MTDDVIQLTRYLDDVGEEQEITCIGVHDSDGSVSAWYTKNKAKMMSVKVSEVKIVGVVCEHLAGEGDIFIYVGDYSGRIITLSRKGEVLAESTISNTTLYTLVHRRKYSVEAIGSRGTFILTGMTTHIKTSKTYEPVFALMPDGGMERIADHGEGKQGRKVVKYNALSPATVTMTWGVDLTRNDEYEVFAVFEEPSQNEVKLHQSEFAIISESISRTIDFGSAVRQVLVRRNPDDAHRGTMFLLLANGEIIKIPELNSLIDPAIENDDIQRIKIATSEKLNSPLEGFAICGPILLAFSVDGLYTLTT